MLNPLRGLKVIEMGGPPAAFASMMLADHGADVLHILRGGEVPAGEQPTIARSASADPLGRGRRTIALDVRQGSGVALFLRLIETADIVIEGFRPGVMERLGIGPAQCLARNPTLIYGRMTGWGQRGPLAELGGHDLTYIALSGLLHAIGQREGPPVPPLNVLGDWAGGLLMAFGIMAAVRGVVQTGEGVVVDTAMVDAALLLGAVPHAAWSVGDWEPGRESNMTDGGWPFYAVYRTLDDRYVAVAALEHKFYSELIDRLGLEGTGIDDPYDRDCWPRMRKAFTQMFLTRTRDEWSDVMEGADACFAPVLDFAEARRDPHVVYRDSFLEYGGIEQPVPAPRFGDQISPIRPWSDCQVPPAQVLREWGLTDDEIPECIA